MIDQTTKQHIKKELDNYVSHSGSQNKAATKLGLSTSTISKIRANDFETIADKMWLKIANALGVSAREKWTHAHTTPADRMSAFFDDAKQFGNVFGLVCTPGSGKTDLLDFYIADMENVFYVKCIRDMSSKELLQQILTSMADRGVYRTTYTMLIAIKEKVDVTANPIIILDEMEKGKNDLFLTFIDLYNLLWKRCGIVMIGTHNLKDRIETGVKRGYTGYNEVLSRLGGKLLEIPLPNREDGVLVVQANGVDEPMDVMEIVNGSMIGDTVDMRMIERKVHAYKQRMLAQMGLEVEA